MLDNSDTATLDAAASDDVVRSMHEVIEHQQAELTFMSPGRPTPDHERH